MDVTMESIITEAMDSLYCNNAYSRSLLRDAMNNTNDSLDYYKALQTYSLTYFVNDQIDSTRHFAEKLSLTRTSRCQTSKSTNSSPHHTIQ